MSKPIRDGYFEASFYQNLLDNLGIPDEIELDVEELLNHQITQELKQLRNETENKAEVKKPISMIADTILNYQQQGMPNIKGQLSFVKDPATLSKMNLKAIQKPEIQNITASDPNDMD